MKTLEQIAEEIGNCIFRIETRNSTLMTNNPKSIDFIREQAKLNQNDFEKLKELKSGLLKFHDTNSR